MSDLRAIVGNDVVDLTDPEIAHHHRRERFVARVCAHEERDLLLGPSPARALWTLFAAKEAAYKALVKLGQEPGFAHRAIVVGPDLKTVRWRELTLGLGVDATEQRVHVVAWTGEGQVLSSSRPATGDLGVQARLLLCESVARLVGCEPSELSVTRDPSARTWDGFGPPRLLLRGAPVAVDVSLSHDGGFVAFAAAIG